MSRRPPTSREQRVIWLLLFVTVAAVVSFLLGIWTGELRWVATGGVLIGFAVPIGVVAACQAMER